MARHALAFLPSSARTSLGNYIKQRRNFSILAKSYGQFASMRASSPIDASGAPIPWYTYPAIEYLSHLELSAMRVFEFGSGNSSLWWLKRCRALTAVEDDRGWYERIRQAAGSDPRFNYVLEQERDSYTRTLAADEFDIVIIDGKHRAACADRFLELRKQGSCGAVMLLFDNADWYPDAVARLRRELPWLQVDFHGFGPINDYTSTTTIFFDPEQVARINHTTALRSVAGLPHDGSAGSVQVESARRGC